MPDRIDSGIDPKFFEEFKQAIAMVNELGDKLVATSKQQINIEIAGNSPRTLVDLNGNMIKLAESTKQVDMMYEGLGQRLAHMATFKDRYNGTTDSLVSLDKKAAAAEKELELAILARAKSDTEASKQHLNNAKAEAEASKIMFTERKRQIMEERELNRMIAQEEKQLAKERAATAKELTAAKRSAQTSYSGGSDTLPAGEAQAGIAAGQQAEAAAAREAAKAQAEYNAAQAAAIPVKTQLVALTDAEIAAELEQETTLKSLSLQLKVLRAEYAELTLVQRESAEGKALLLQIQGMDTEVKNLDRSMGNSQRNVGNYISAMTSMEAIGKKLFTAFLRMGIHFLAFTVAIKGIEWIINKFTGLGKEADKAELAIKKYEDSLKSIEATQAGAAQSEIAHLTVLTKVASDVNSTMANRLRAVKELQDTYPARFGALSKEAILEGQVGDAVHKTTQELLARASAQAAEKKIAEAGEKRYALILSQREEQEKLNKSTADFNELNAALAKSTNPNEHARTAAVRLATDMQTSADKVKSLGDQIAKADKEIQGYGEDAVNFAEKAGSTFFGKDAKPKKVKGTPDLTNAELKGEADYTKALYDQLKIRAENEAEIQKDIAEDDTNNLEKRAQAYDKFSMERIKAAGFAMSAEYDIVQQKLDKIAEIESKAPAKRTTEEKKLLLEKAALQQQQLNLVESFELAQTKVVNDNAKFRTGLIKQYGKEANDAIDQIRKNLSGVGSIGGPTQTHDEGMDAIYEKQKKVLNDAYSFTNNLANLNTGLTQRRINEIDKEIAAIEKRKDAEIDAINASGASEEDKKKRITEANAKAQAQEDALNEKKRQEQRKDAELHKAINVAKIGIETALAVIHQATTGDTYTAFARALAVGALGAAELAAAIATPIPEFAKGTENSPEGPARLGEQGTELVIPKSGKPWLADRDMVAMLERGTVVKTAAETADIFKYFAVGMPMLRQGSYSKDYPMDEIMDHHADKIVEAINRKRFPSQQATPAWYQQYHNQRSK